MQIEDFKTWHWVAIGLIAGLAFSLVLVMSGPPFATQELDTIDASTFEHALLGRLLRPRAQSLVAQYHKGQPLMRDVIVHPPLRGADPHQFWVTGQLYAIAPRFKNPTDPMAGEVVADRWLSFKYPATAPYVGQNGAGIAGAKFPTVAEYVAAADKAKLTDVTCRVAWQESPAAVWSLPPVAGLLIIGIAWPLTLGIMRSAGMTRPPVVKAAPAPAAPPPPAPKPAPAVRVVVAPPPPPPPPPVAVGDQKEYGGEFYPVVKPVHHEPEPARNE
jgi:hypothetical protein